MASWVSLGRGEFEVRHVGGIDFLGLQAGAEGESKEKRGDSHGFNCETSRSDYKESWDEVRDCWDGLALEA